MQLKFRNLSQVVAVHDFDINLVFADRWIFGHMNRVDNEVLLDHVSGRVFLIDSELPKMNIGENTSDSDADDGDTNSATDRDGGDDTDAEDYIPPLSEVLYSIFLGNDGILNADIQAQVLKILAQDNDVVWTSPLTPFGKYTICLCGDSCSIADHFSVYRNANMANVLSWEA